MKINTSRNKKSRRIRRIVVRRKKEKGKKKNGQFRYPAAGWPCRRPPEAGKLVGLSGLARRKRKLKGSRRVH